jgi:hypothetical protein
VLPIFVWQHGISYLFLSQTMYVFFSFRLRLLLCKISKQTLNNALGKRFDFLLGGMIIIGTLHQDDVSEVAYPTRNIVRMLGKCSYIRSTQNCGNFEIFRFLALSSLRVLSQEIWEKIRARMPLKRVPFSPFARSQNIRYH